MNEEKTLQATRQLRDSSRYPLGMIRRANRYSL